MSFTLVLKGTTYFNQAAGTGGDEFEASDNAENDRTEKIIYLHVTEGWLGFKKKTIREAYVTRQCVDSCATLGIVYYDPNSHRQNLESLGAGAYALYRFDL